VKDTFLAVGATGASVDWSKILKTMITLMTHKTMQEMRTLTP
jgi:hypothetical protein